MIPKVSRILIMRSACRSPEWLSRHPGIPTVPITTGNGIKYHFSWPVHLPLLDFWGFGSQYKNIWSVRPLQLPRTPGADSLLPQIGSIFHVAKGCAGNSIVMNIIWEFWRRVSYSHHIILSDLKTTCRHLFHLASLINAFLLAVSCC